ncbi:MAG: hypothetical protein ACJZ1P_06280 [Candidatus Neomarinimicrobiota bacterium]|tara:strand:+ start:167 stop:334 length:168 start_codon:yes stop_codon:yes gene_type:complete
MIKLLILGTFAYFIYILKNKFTSKNNDPYVKEKDSYKNLNIKDADYEDINQENES